MVDWEAIINSTVTEGYLQQIFGVQQPTLSIIIFFVFCAVIGFTSILWRYTINSKDEQEYQRWKEEHWLTKIFLSILTGFFGYVTIIALSELFSSLSFLFTGQITKMLEGNFSIFAVIFSVMYTTTWLMLLGAKQKKHYIDIQKFVIRHVFISPTLGILGASFAILRLSKLLGLAIFLFALFFAWQYFQVFHLTPHINPNANKNREAIISFFWKLWNKLGHIC